MSVNWQVNGVKGDKLHKIGEGTLTVQGTGINEGGLKVGAKNIKICAVAHVLTFSLQKEIDNSRREK